MQIRSVDHFVLTVESIPATVLFYTTILGMQEEIFESGGFSRHALKFGEQKINLHQQGKEFLPGANVPLPGTADFCLLTDTSIEDVMQELVQKEGSIEEGPVHRTGATGKLLSVYLRDPDQNLVEIASLAD